MATGPIATAYVEITSQLDPKATADLQKQFSKAADKVSTSLSDAVSDGLTAGAKAAEGAAKQITRTFDRLDPLAGLGPMFDDAFADATAIAKGSADDMADAFAKAARAAVDNLTPLERALSDLAKVEIGVALDPSEARVAAEKFRAEMADKGITVPVDIDASGAEAAIETARQKVTEVGEAGETAAGGIRTTTGAFRDLTDSFGGGTNQLFGFAAAMEGVGDIAEGLAVQMGVAETAVAGFTSGLGLALGAFALIGVAFSAFQTFTKNWNHDAEEARKRTEEWTRALKEANGAIELVASQRLTEAFTLDPKLVDAANTVKISWQDMVDVVSGEAVPAFDKFRRETKVTTDTINQFGRANRDTVRVLAERLDISQDQAQALIDENDERRKVVKTVEQETKARAEAVSNQEALTEAQTQGATAAKDYGEALGNIPTQDLADFLNLATDQDKMNQLTAQSIGVFDGLAEAVGSVALSAEDIKHVQLADEIDRIMAAAAVDTLDELNQQAESFASILEDIAGSASRNLRGLIDVNQALANLGETLKENGKNFDINTEAGRKNVEAVLDVGDAMRKQVENLVASGGSFADAERKAAGFRTELTKQLKAAGASKAEIDNLVHSVGLLPTDIKMAVELEHGEDAKRKLDDLKDVIDQLPPDVKVVVDQQIQTGDYQGAVKTVQDYAADNPAVQQIEPQTPTPAQIATIVAAVESEMNKNKPTMTFNTAIDWSNLKKDTQDALLKLTGVHIPVLGMAMGGIVPSTPGGQLLRVGEAGPEAIIPLSRPQRAAEVLAAAGMRARDVNLTIYGSADPGRTAADFTRELRALQWRLGQRFL